MVTVTADGTRGYSCRNTQCPRRFVEAEHVEPLVWQRFAALNETLASGIPDSGKHGALRAVLRRVVITSGAPEATIEWRD